MILATIRTIIIAYFTGTATEVYFTPSVTELTLVIDSK